MQAKPQHNDEQAKLWNGPAGHAWVEMQDVMDQLFKPFEALLVEAASAHRGGRVLDVGCGTGGTTLAIAQTRDTHGQAVGVDISAQMVALARARAQRQGSPAQFVCADVQTHAFEAASFDTVVSRFGVMFFADPVQAFANLRHATRVGGDLHVIAWRSAAENPFMTAAEQIAAPLLPSLPVRQPNAPGQFAFADRARIGAILQDSGWKDIDIRPIDVTCVMQEKDLLAYLTRFGPVGQALREMDDRASASLLEAVRAAFDAYVDGDEVRFTAACWRVGAHA